LSVGEATLIALSSDSEWDPRQEESHFGLQCVVGNRAIRSIARLVSEDRGVYIEDHASADRLRHLIGTSGSPSRYRIGHNATMSGRRASSARLDRDVTPVVCA
jgi:hypothetical protein